ncbi:MAG: hypothetical protein AAF728_11420 [Cyanobacteria bacterium P01_D01_bin.128]
MLQAISRLLKIQTEETPLVLTLGLILLGNSLAIQISYVASVSGFLSEVGVNEFLLVLIANYSLILLTIVGQSLIIDRFGRVQLVRGLIFGLAVIFVVLRLMFLLKLPDTINYSFFYLLAEQQWLLFPIIFWVLASDIFDISQAKRLFPIIAGFGFFGRLLGIGIATISPLLFQRLDIQSEELITLNILIYLILYIVTKLGLAKIKIRSAKQTHEGFKEILAEGTDFVKAVPAFRYLTFSLLALAVCDVIVEFHFLAVSNSAFPDPDRYQSFYGLYRLILTVLSFGIQTFLSSRIIKNLGLKNSFVIMPIAVCLGLILVVISPNVISALAMIMLYRLSCDTTDESARKSFQGLVPEERRGRVSLFMDGYLLAVGGILGGVITGIIILVGLAFNITFYSYIYLGLGIAAAGFSVFSILRMRRVYDKSLLNWRLKRRQRGRGVLDRLDGSTPKAKTKSVFDRLDGL